MDFDRIVAQRAAKQTVTSSEETDQMLSVAAKRAVEFARSKPGPKPKATSKRNDPDWVAATFYLKVDTKAQLDRYLALTKLDTDGDHPADQSELIELALAAFLGKQMPKLEGKVLGK
jgi:hypothetical protein